MYIGSLHKIEDLGGVMKVDDQGEAIDLSSGVRERVWAVLEDWFTTLGNGAVAMIWQDGAVAGGLALRHLGDPPKEIRDADGVLLVKRCDLLRTPLRRSLTIE